MNGLVRTIQMNHSKLTIDFVITLSWKIQNAIQINPLKLREELDMIHMNPYMIVNTI